MTDAKPNYEKLEIWQEAMALTKIIYLKTKDYPKEEKFGITDQVRRAGLSVALNIAEGAGRGSKADFRRFLLIAKGSLNEVLTLFTLSLEIGLISSKEYDDIRSMVLRLMRRIQALISKLQDFPSSKP
ncbi:MAG: four helix bundle protein [Candidatus Liptonbacteria bacterium]|nr:four helix bundle protein [Candidatus Liptonbacteria bacterium]